ncbi:MAG: hypothetical protein RL199_950 [Pseudomonadota bacterium]|jgi:hypothetical protein
MKPREQAAPKSAPASPNEELARRVVEQLVGLGLLPPDDRQRYAAAIAAGDMRASDWRLAVEKALERPE